jgi:hypothetical protein
MLKKTIEEVAHIVEREGLDYAIQSYMSYESIEDEELSNLWKEADILLNKIEFILEPYYEEEL